ncbi:2-polyprenyl-6-methoxyphenol hydroxylase [Singulisphaera sp. GP187]|uniref:FAD-dependent oxidoreductase n=1 Tax=Singulisphaera sp. GP187 TaxID=1882752 RepID=UPI000929AE1F|nr:NAD(P)/FAD-dependent oxidoreductase [Singulisphaera sp. GP187]SIN74356.1 2-polyprenyl-6-methoxyphenol hydroxylase [Singulisphaera sp. GP187]
MKKSPRIAIVGGGPGGLALARILHLRGVSATVFERDATSIQRSQGGSLDLHADTGQHALRLAGLEDEFLGIARYEDQGTRLFDRDGVLHFEEEGEAADFDRPEVDRTALRQILLDSLPPGVVRWGHRLHAIAPHDDGTNALRFENGQAATFDLVVGADGTRSRVRPLVSDAVPVYSGISFVSLGFDDVDLQHPEIAQLVRHGMLFAMGENRGLIAHRDANAHVGVYVALRVPEDWVSSGIIDINRPSDAREKLAGYFAGWSPNLVAMIRESGDRIAILPLHALPVGHRWENRPGVTLLGDAAHVMSPFSGEGVNLAMIDAADLAVAIADAEDWRSAILKYEEAMFTRAEVAAAGAAEAIESAFSDDGFEYLLKHMRSRHEVQR